MGGRLLAEARAGADPRAPAEAPEGPPPESSSDAEGDHEDRSHVTLTVAELRRLLHPQAASD